MRSPWKMVPAKTGIRPAEKRNILREAPSRGIPHFPSGGIPAWILFLGLAMLTPGMARSQPPAPPRVTIHSSFRGPTMRAGDHPAGIILSAQARPEPISFSWKINGVDARDLSPELGRVLGSPGQGIIVYRPPVGLSGHAVELSIVAIAHMEDRNVPSDPFPLTVRPPDPRFWEREPAPASRVRSREEPIPPSCKTALEKLNAELSAYAELLQRERANRARNEDVIAVLTRIRTLSEQARHCTGHNLGLLDKLQLNLVNRLGILIKDKAKNLWARYDALAERLRDARPGQTPSILRQIFEIQVEIKAMYEKYQMEMSRGIVERLDADGRMIRNALNRFDAAQNRSGETKGIDP